MISEQHDQIGRLFAPIYKKVAWQKITSVKRSAVDILTDRIRVASKERDILKAHDKLCSSLNLSSAKLDITEIELLHKDNEMTMTILRDHPGYIAALTQKTAKEDKHEN